MTTIGQCLAEKGIGYYDQFPDEDEDQTNYGEISIEKANERHD